jgi:hypothetical protein
MAFWNTNDREESKPNWLNAGQKRYCVRTVRGWEVPIADGNSNLANQFDGAKTLSVTGNVPLTEVLVALPIDPSITGLSASNWTGRQVPGISGGTASSDTPNYAPYITCPFGGDSFTAGGMDSLGLSHSSSTNYGVNGYGVSTLYHNTYAAGATSYIKVVANDVNFTNTLTLSLTGQLTGGGTGGTKTIAFYTGSSLLTTSNVPADVYETFFGATSTYNNSIGVIRMPNGLTPGNYGLTANVFDGTVTGSSKFTVTTY